MINLPAEVLHLIFPQLATRDKLECMTVCRQWEQVISHSLFRIIYIQSLAKLNKLIGRLEKDPVLGTKVERLILKLDSENDFDETALIDLIPNVREFTFLTLDSYENDDYNTDDSDADDTGPITRVYRVRKRHPWCNHIERIVEDTPATYTNALLHSGLCRNLTHLSLTGRRSLSATGVIALLDNTPALKILELRAYKITLGALEMLHLSVPTLTSITMRWCHMKCTVFPRNIEPATSVKVFRSVECSTSCGEDGPYIKYIIPKYTNLEEMAFKSYDLGLMEKDEAESAAEIRTMMVSYLNKLRMGLKTLSVSLAVFGNDMVPCFDFDVLDESGCQIEKLALDSIRRISVFEQLANTAQVKYIRSLKVNEFPYDANNVDGSISLKWFTHFTLLEELSLVFRPTKNWPQKPRLNLADLLDSVAEAQVEILELVNVELSFNTSGDFHTYPLIKYLTLDNADLKDNTDIAISRSLINLRSLTLANCIKKKTSLVLPMTQLSYLEVSERYTYGPLRVLIMTSDNNQQRAYTAKMSGIGYRPEGDTRKTDPLSLPSFSSQPCNGSTDMSALSIVCKSVCHCFVINKY